MSSTTVRIEPVLPDQVEILLGLIHQLAEYERRSEQVSATHERLCDALFGDTPSAEAVLAWEDDHPIGYALFFPIFSTFRAQTSLYIEDLYVVPEARGRGIGSLLMGYLANLALERGWNRLEWQVLDWNTPAIEFYRRLGAVPKESDWVPYKLEGEPLNRLADDYRRRVGESGGYTV